MMHWTESLAGPRSLLTGPDIAVTAVEDPAFIVLHLPENQHDLRDELSGLLGFAFAGDVGTVAQSETGSVLARCAADEWWCVHNRHEARALRDASAAQHSPFLVSLDLTGHFAAFRLAGTAQDEIIGKVMDDFPETNGALSRLTIDQARCIRLSVMDRSTSLSLLLVPRSRAASLAEKIVAAATMMPRIGLFAA